MNYDITIQRIDALIIEMTNIKSDLVRLRDKSHGIGLTEAEKELERQNLLYRSQVPNTAHVYYPEPPRIRVKPEAYAKRRKELKDQGIELPAPRRGRPPKNKIP